MTRGRFTAKLTKLGFLPGKQGFTHAPKTRKIDKVKKM